jgi:hypothetical protein
MTVPTEWILTVLIALATILSFGTALGMTSDDLDNLFRLGGSLTV